MLSKETFRISMLKSVQSAPSLEELSWDGICKLAQNSSEQVEGKEGFGICPSIFKGVKRRIDDALVSSCLALDIEDVLWSDDPEVIERDLKGILPGVAMLVYTTYNHGVRFVVDEKGVKKPKWTPDHPRLRVIIPFNKEIDAKEDYNALHAWSRSVFPGVDKQTSDPSRVMYLPRVKSASAELDPWIFDIKGVALDVDAIPYEGDVVSLVELKEVQEAKSKSSRKFAKSSGTTDQDLIRIPFTTPELKEALSHIPDNEDRGTWLRVGAALHDYAEEGLIQEGTAIDLWDEWSKGASNYEIDGCLKTWKSFRVKGNKVTMGSLIFMARQGGWNPPRRPQYEGFLLGTSDPKICEHLMNTVYNVQDQKFRDGYLWYPQVVPLQLDNVAEFDSFFHANMMVWDKGGMWTYDFEEGLWTEVTEEEILYRVGQLDGLSYGPVDKPKTFLVTSSKGASVYKQMRAGAKYNRPNFFDEAPAQISFLDTTLLWDDDGGRLFEIWGRRTPMFARSKHRIPITLWEPTKKWDWKSTKDIDSSEWVQFLRSSFIVDYDPSTYDPSHDEAQEASARIKALQMYIGACLFGKAVDTHKALTLVGPGGGGKSIFIDVIESLFDPKAISHIAPQKMGEKYSNYPLVYSILNTVADVDRKELLNTGMLKQVLAGDAIQVEQKYRDAENCKPSCGHIFSINEFPAVSDHSKGMWDRWILISFPQEFRGTSKEDKGLKNRLKTESSKRDIIHWAIDGFLQWIRSDKKIPLPKCHDELMSEWNMETDSVYEYVHVHRLDPSKFDDKSLWSPANSAYEQYKSWCMITGKKFPLSLHKWGKRMKIILGDPGWTRKGDGIYYAVLQGLVANAT